jgi:ubiquinone/menaquinone biosynthesis C-methylase UbiE
MAKKIAEYANTLKGDIMLDFGCGHKPYRSLFPQIKQYIGVDFDNDGHTHDKEQIDVFYDGLSLPFPNQYFDCAICTEVLEHVPDIEVSLALLKRVLKTNASVIISLPFVWPEHEMPFDFRRFTTGGLVKELEKEGFEIQQTYKNGNSASVIIELFIMFIHNLLYTKIVFLNYLINLIFIFPFTLLGIILSAIFRNQKGLYFNTVLLAVKKE